MIKPGSKDIRMQQVLLFLTWFLTLKCGLTSTVPSLQANDLKRLQGLTPDPYVTAAPLVIGAVCADGVVVVALHTSFASEPLLLDTDDLNRTTLGNETAHNSTWPQDLPPSYRGPFRIHPVDGRGTVLVCAGWRADGQALVDHCRSIASEEKAKFGPPPLTSEYGFYLASESSLWMAKAAVSEQVRPLSTAALLTSPGRPKHSGYLWLVDATGAFRVRAHCLGGGTLSGILNQELEHLALADCDSQDALRQILDMLSRQDIPTECRVEMAHVGTDENNQKPRFQRLFSSSLFGVRRRHNHLKDPAVA